jgi:hypothetical protein
MSKQQISWTNLFSGFQSREIDTEELEMIIRETVEREHPDDPIVDLKYDDEGINITLDSGDEVSIEIDWNEIVLT